MHILSKFKSFNSEKKKKSPAIAICLIFIEYTKEFNICYYMSKLDCKSYLEGDELFRFTKASKCKNHYITECPYQYSKLNLPLSNCQSNL